jgi:hypothetical protein
MDDYEAAEARRAAMAQARAEANETLERTSGIEVRRSDYSKRDALTEWRRGQPRQELPAPERKLTDAEALRWRAYIDGRVAAGIAAALAERDMLSDARLAATGKALGAFRAQLRQEMQEQIGSLRADVEIISKAHAGDSKVVDLPAFIGKRDVGR